MIIAWDLSIAKCANPHMDPATISSVVSCITLVQWLNSLASSQGLCDARNHVSFLHSCHGVWQGFTGSPVMIASSRDGAGQPLSLLREAAASRGGSPLLQSDTGQAPAHRSTTRSIHHGFYNAALLWVWIPIWRQKPWLLGYKESRGISSIITFMRAGHWS